MVRPIRTVFWLFLAIFVSGCGADLYEARLGETVKYFEYLEKVNKSLSPNVWQEYGIELRVPKQFEYLPPSAPEEAPLDSEDGDPVLPDDSTVVPNELGPADGDGDPEAVVEEPHPYDSRQPEYIDLYLPGLLGAWKAEVNVIDGTGVKPGNVYFYLMTNHSMWLEREEGVNVDPLTFHQLALEEIAAGLGVIAPSDVQPWNWEDERVPRGAGYVPRKTLEKVVHQAEIDGEPTDFIVYKYHVKDVQLLFLLVVPQRIDRPVPLQNAVTHCFEQLKVAPEIPTTRGGGGSGTSSGPAF